MLARNTNGIYVGKPHRRKYVASHHTLVPNARILADDILAFAGLLVRESIGGGRSLIGAGRCHWLQNRLESAWRRLDRPRYRDEPSRGPWCVPRRDPGVRLVALWGVEVTTEVLTCCESTEGEASDELRRTGILELLREMRAARPVERAIFVQAGEGMWDNSRSAQSGGDAPVILPCSAWAKMGDSIASVRDGSAAPVPAGLPSGPASGSTVEASAAGPIGPIKAKHSDEGTTVLTSLTKACKAAERLGGGSRASSKRRSNVGIGEVRLHLQQCTRNDGGGCSLFGIAAVGMLPEVLGVFLAATAKALRGPGVATDAAGVVAPGSLPEASSSTDRLLPEEAVRANPHCARDGDMITGIDRQPPQKP
eukprot:scaffold9912_cov96-Isochrysis_galbana.AAC.4